MHSTILDRPLLSAMPQHIQRDLELQERDWCAEYLVHALDTQDIVMHRRIILLNFPNELNAHTGWRIQHLVERDGENGIRDGVLQVTLCPLRDLDKPRKCRRIQVMEHGKPPFCR